MPGLARSLGVDEPRVTALLAAAEKPEDEPRRLKRGIGPARVVSRYTTPAPDGVRLLQLGKSDKDGLTPVMGYEELRDLRLVGQQLHPGEPPPPEACSRSRPTRGRVVILARGRLLDLWVTRIGGIMTLLLGDLARGRLGGRLADLEFTGQGDPTSGRYAGTVPVAQAKGWTAEKDITALIRRAAGFPPQPEVMHLTPARLLLGVISSGDSVVCDALTVSGACLEALQRALQHRLSCEVHDVVNSTYAKLVTHGLELMLPPTTRGLLESAAAEAATLEHYDLEPGHLLLVWTRGPALEGHRELVMAGADADRLASALTQRLPGVAPFFQAQIEAALHLSRLSDTDAQALIRCVERTPTPTAEHGNAVETLIQRHLFLGWEPAVKAAGRGHRLEYCCSIATNAVLGACLNAAKAHGTFSTWVLARIERALELHLKDAPKENL
jgi:hypothetical protein